MKIKKNNFIIMKKYIYLNLPTGLVLVLCKERFVLRSIEKLLSPKFVSIESIRKIVLIDCVFLLLLLGRNGKMDYL